MINPSSHPGLVLIKFIKSKTQTCPVISIRHLAMMIKMSIALALLFTLATSVRASALAPVVETNFGRVVGTVVQAGSSNVNFYNSIRYGKL